MVEPPHIAFGRHQHFTKSATLEQLFLPQFPSLALGGLFLQSAKKRSRTWLLLAFSFFRGGIKGTLLWQLTRKK
jgi:hypothetical protein